MQYKIKPLSISKLKADNHQKIMKKGGQPESGPGNRVPIVPAFVCL